MRSCIRFFACAILALAGSSHALAQLSVSTSAGAGTIVELQQVSGKVKCANVAGTPDVDAYTYSFTLLPDCEAGLRAYYDTTGDQRLTTDDLTGWFASPRDYDRNGAADTADLVRLMQAVAGSPH